MKICKLQQGNIIHTTRGNFIKDKNGILHVLNNQGDIEQQLDGEVVIKPKAKQSAFTKAMIGTAMASDPAVMQASGWRQNEQGEWGQERTAGSDELAENLAILSMSSPTHPLTAATDWAIGLGTTLFKNLKDTYTFIKGRHPTFKSELDWSPKSWFGEAAKRKLWTSEDEIALASHVPEYNQIEQTAKANGTWLKMKDGSIWQGDPRSWVQLQSNNGTHLIQKHHYVGTSNSPTFNRAEQFPTYTGETWAGDTFKGVSEYARNGKTGKIKPLTEKEYQEELNKALNGVLKDQDPNSLFYNYVMDKLQSQRLYGRGQLEGTGKVYDITYPKTAKQSPVYEANNTHWSNMNNEISTDALVKKNFDSGFDVTKINKVIDTEDGSVLNETILKAGVPRKSLLGNNGDFNLKNKNIYRSFFPFVGLTPTLGIKNK